MWAERGPDRVLALTQEIGMNTQAYSYSLDDDDAVDLGGIVYTAPNTGVYVYLGDQGKSARTRSFTLEDADVIYRGGYVLSRWEMGSLNDSTGRYGMLPLGGVTSQGHHMRWAVSGGSRGPDQDYDAWYAPGLDGLGNENVFNHGASLGDVTGDGYSDMIYSSPLYGLGEPGIAFVLAGGAYIPLDDPTVDVREVPVAGEAGGLYVWPNPVETELHLAWRGNLKAKPARFAVYDAAGREIVSGDVDPHRGEALWRCASVAAGTYILIAYDNTGTRITTTGIIKR